MEANLFAGLSWCALIAGLVIFFHALLADRARGRRRCPKCWYDLSRTNGLRCPECGHEAKRDRALFRTRRRWRWAAFGVLVVLVSHPVARIPVVRAHGAAAFAPDWLLVAVLPWYEERLPPTVNQSIYTASYSWPFEELNRRITVGDLGFVGWQLLIERCLAGDSRRPLHTEEWLPFNKLLLLAEEGGRLESPTLRARLRSSGVYLSYETHRDWPVGVPVGAALTLNSSFVRFAHASLEPITPGLESQEVWLNRPDLGGGGMSGGWSNGPDLRPLGMPSPDVTELRYRVVVREFTGHPRREHQLGATIARFDLTIPISIHGQIDDYIRIEPVEQFCREMNRTGIAILDESDARIVGPAFINQTLGDVMARAKGDAGGLPTIGFRAEIYTENEVIATCEIWESIGTSHFDEYGIPLSMRIVDRERVRALRLAGKEVRVRVSMDPVIALRDMDCSHALTGSFDVPVEFIGVYVHRDTDFDAIDSRLSEVIESNLELRTTGDNRLLAYGRFPDDHLIELPFGVDLTATVGELLADGAVIGQLKTRLFLITTGGVMGRFDFVGPNLDDIEATELVASLRSQFDDLPADRAVADSGGEPPFNAVSVFQIRELRVPVRRVATHESTRGHRSDKTFDDAGGRGNVRITPFEWRGDSYESAKHSNEWSGETNESRCHSNESSRETNE